MTAREVTNKLTREGWASRPGKGSHTVFSKSGHPIVVVPNHRGDLAPGTLRSICKAAGWSYPPTALEVTMAQRHYIGIAERGPNNWSISFPAFPGVFTVGDSLADLLSHARDALASAVESMQEDGQAIPEDDTEGAGAGFSLIDYKNPHMVIVSAEVGGKAQRINVTMEEGLLARLDALADRTRSSRSALLAQGARLVLAAGAD